MIQEARNQTEYPPIDRATESRTLDLAARERNLYGVQILRCSKARKIEIAASQGPTWVLDFATNSPFGLNLRDEVRQASLQAVESFGALHASIACGRGQTGTNRQVMERLERMKGPDSSARIYPTTFAANCAVAAGLQKMNCIIVMHPNVHATVQFALKGALAHDRIIRTKNTAEVATALAQSSRRNVVIVEDGLYSMGQFADFQAIAAFLENCPNGRAWFDDAHSVGMRGIDGRGEAMEQMNLYSNQCIVTGSFGKAYGSVGGFLVAPRSFVCDTLEVSVSDRFSCNLDVAAQGGVLAAMNLLGDPVEYKRLQDGLNERLRYADQYLARHGIFTEQHGTPIAFRVVSFASPMKAIQAAGKLLADHGILSTPVYFPTVAFGTGAIRFAISADHELNDVERLLEALVPLVKESL